MKRIETFENFFQQSTQPPAVEKFIAAFEKLGTVKGYESFSFYEQERYGLVEYVLQVIHRCPCHGKQCSTRGSLPAVLFDGVDAERLAEVAILMMERSYEYAFEKPHEPQDLIERDRRMMEAMAEEEVEEDDA